jgi:hypothetical protein
LTCQAAEEWCQWPMRYEVSDVGGINFCPAQPVRETATQERLDARVYFANRRCCSSRSTEPHQYSFSLLLTAGIEFIGSLGVLSGRIILRQGWLESQLSIIIISSKGWVCCCLDLRLGKFRGMQFLGGCGTLSRKSMQGQPGPIWEGRNGVRTSQLLVGEEMAWALLLLLALEFLMVSGQDERNRSIAPQKQTSRQTPKWYQ